MSSSERPRGKICFFQNSPVNFFWTWNYCFFKNVASDSLIKVKEFVQNEMEFNIVGGKPVAAHYLNSWKTSLVHVCFNTIA